MGAAQLDDGFVMRGERNGLLRAGLGRNRLGGCTLLEAFGVAGSRGRLSESEFDSFDDVVSSDMEDG